MFNRSAVDGWNPSVAAQMLSLVHRAVRRGPFRGRGAIVRTAARLCPAEVPVKIGNGFWFQLDLTDPYDRMIFEGGYEPLLLRILNAVLGPGDLFIDCGANVGLHMLAAAVSVGDRGRVIAFEPDSEAHARATVNVGLNPRLRPRIDLRRVAVGDREGTVRMSADGDRHLQSRVTDEGEPVACVTMDAAVTELAGDYPLVVCKLDIEGFELRALSAAKNLLSRRDLVVVSELNDPLLRQNGGSASELITLFRTNGFSCWGEDGQPLDSFDPSWPDWTNGIFVRGPEAEARLRRGFGGARTSGGGK